MVNHHSSSKSSP